MSDNKQEGNPVVGMHLDFHTTGWTNLQLGKDEVAGLVNRLSEWGVEEVRVVAKCNQGYGYLRSKNWRLHPGMQEAGATETGSCDWFREVVKGLAEKGIRVLGYVHVGLDEASVREHPEWVRQSGEIYENMEKRLGEKRSGHWDFPMCLNSGFGEAVLELLEEVAQVPGLDGIFLDGFNESDCQCASCESSRESLWEESQLDWEDGEIQGELTEGKKSEKTIEINLCRRVNLDFFERAVTRIKEANVGLSISGKGLPEERCGDWIDFPSVPGFGNFRDVDIRLKKRRDVPGYVLSARFDGDWGQFGMRRSREGLIWEGIRGMSGGEGVVFGDHLLPNGQWEPGMEQTWKEVIDVTKKCRQAIVGTNPVFDLQIVVPEGEELLQSEGRELYCFLEEENISYELIHWKQIGEETNGVLILGSALNDIWKSCEEKLEKSRWERVTEADNGTISLSEAWNGLQELGESGRPVFVIGVLPGSWREIVPLRYGFEPYSYVETEEGVHRVQGPVGICLCEGEPIAWSWLDERLTKEPELLRLYDPPMLGERVVSGVIKEYKKNFGWLAMDFFKGVQGAEGARRMSLFWKWLGIVGFERVCEVEWEGEKGCYQVRADKNGGEYLFVWGPEWGISPAGMGEIRGLRKPGGFRVLYRGKWFQSIELALEESVFCGDKNTKKEIFSRYRLPE